MGPSTSKQKRKKRNKNKREQLEERAKHFYRRKQGINTDEDEVDLASYLRRGVQYLIDLSIASIIALFMLAILEQFVDIENIHPAIYLAPQFVAFLVYFLPGHIRSGQTFACKKLKIVVIKSDGTGYIDIPSAFMRWVVLYLLPYLYVLFITEEQTAEERLSIAIFGLLVTCFVAAPVFFTKKRQGFHDLFAKSMVVRDWN